MRRASRLPLLLLACASTLDAQIIPQPNHHAAAAGETRVPATITVAAQDSQFAALLPTVTQLAQKYFGITLVAVAGPAFVELRRDSTLRQAEAYRLELGRNRIVVEAGSPNGGFYGLQSVLQLLADPEGAMRTGTIDDSPRFVWRGLMLDESRHFFGPDEVMLILDLMAIHKLNRFHWHLTDTSGWRIEIKRYPRLTSIGAMGNQSDSTAAARYYTQAEIRQIVQYARERFIEIIPEIDMPGHATAAVRAYPELSGGGSPENPHFTFNPGKEATYRFLEGVLAEIAALFPTAYLHIGGDEVRLGNAQWAGLPEVQRMMDDLGLTDLAQVEQAFLRRMAGFVATMGKKAVVWDEALAAGLVPQRTVVMWWRHNRPQVLQQALEQKYPVVLSPRIPMYFDFVQHGSHEHGRKWAQDYVPLESVYEFPAPRFTGNVSIDDPLVMGIQANLWTDRMHSSDRLQFMLYPRISALAEAAWTQEDAKNWSSFEDRMESMFELYRRAGIRFFDYRRITDEVEGPRRSPGAGTGAAQRSKLRRSSSWIE